MSSRRKISSGSLYEPRIGFSRAVRVRNRVLVAGTAPIWPDGSCPDDPATQARRCIEIMADAEAVGSAHGEFFKDIRPAATMPVAGGLLDPRWRIEMEAEAEALIAQR